MSIVLTLCIATSPQAADINKVKAAFLFNFAKFVQWPSTQATQPFRLCVYGDELMFRTLEELPIKSLKNKPLEILNISDPTLLSQCDLAYLNSRELTVIQFILNTLEAHSVLTVSDIDTFAKSGGSIQFKYVDQQVRFDINNTAAQFSHLTISSKLLELAQNVY